MATAAKPLQSKTAERLLKEIVEHAHITNLNEGLAYRVRELIVFGSVTRGADRPNDVDIACELEPRFEGDQQTVVEDQRRAMKGTFRTTIEWAYWPKFEVLKALKSRSRGLSIHEKSDRVLETVDHRVIFTDGPGPKIEVKPG